MVSGIYNAMDISLSFSELRCKEVVNISDGRRLGRPVDIVFTSRARVVGIVTPAPRKGMFRREEDILIPWHAIAKIGDDVILVKLDCRSSSPPPRDCDVPPRRHHPPCDCDCPPCAGRHDDCDCCDCRDGPSDCSPC